MADLKYYDIISKPVITEKSMAGMEYKKYTFYVHTDATKTQIKTALTLRFLKVCKIELLTEAQIEFAGKFIKTIA